MRAQRQPAVKRESPDKRQHGVIGASMPWCRQHATELALADELLGARFGDMRQRGEFTNASLVDEIFNNILMSSLKSKAQNGKEECAQDSTSGSPFAEDDATSRAESNSSVLLLGEAGAGKTHAVEYCIQRLREAKGGDSTIVLRAYGGAYATDVECVRHLAAQVRGNRGDTGLDVDVPSRNASFETGMEWIREVLREGFRHTSAVVIVLEKFEHFCSKARQTLLYNLFDIAQESGVRLSIIGTSEKMDVMDLLEKRIRSRFSMRHLHAFRPTRMDDLISILMEKLRLPEDGNFKAPFVKTFHTKLQAALRAKSAHWAPHLDAGRPPAWFLWKCLPVARLLLEADDDVVDVDCPGPMTPAAPALPAAKRRRATPAALPATDYGGSCTKHEEQMSVVGQLSEDEHIVMLALHRIQARGVVPTLALALHEVNMLHVSKTMLMNFSEDRYEDAFHKLLEARILEFVGPASTDVPRRYRPCQSRALRSYSAFIDELLCKVGVALTWNPLRGLPEVVRLWAGEMMRKEN